MRCCTATKNVTLTAACYTHLQGTRRAGGIRDEQGTHCESDSPVLSGWRPTWRPPNEENRERRAARRAPAISLATSPGALISEAPTNQRAPTAGQWAVDPVGPVGSQWEASGQWIQTAVDPKAPEPHASKAANAGADDEIRSPHELRSGSKGARATPQRLPRLHVVVRLTGTLCARMSSSNASLATGSVAPYLPKLMLATDPAGKVSARLKLNPMGAEAIRAASFASSTPAPPPAHARESQRWPCPPPTGRLHRPLRPWRGPSVAFPGAPG